MFIKPFLWATGGRIHEWIKQMPLLLGSLYSQCLLPSSRRSLWFFCSTPGFSLVLTEVISEERSWEEIMLIYVRKNIELFMEVIAQIPDAERGVRTWDLEKPSEKRQKNCFHSTPRPCLSWSVVGVGGIGRQVSLADRRVLWEERWVNKIWGNLLLCVMALLLPVWETQLLALDLSFLLGNIVLKLAKNLPCFLGG